MFSTKSRDTDREEPHYRLKLLTLLGVVFFSGRFVGGILHHEHLFENKIRVSN
jgi:hypothetical protein